METSNYVAIAAVFAAIFTAISTHINLRCSQSFQIRSEKTKHDREQAVRLKTEAIKRLEDAHKLLSKIAREFSIDNLVIQWDAMPTADVFDLDYLQSCSNLDDLRAIAAIHEPTLSKDIDTLRGQMSLYWFHLTNAFAQKRNGKSTGEISAGYKDASAASFEISRIVQGLKDDIVQLAKQHEST